LRKWQGSASWQNDCAHFFIENKNIKTDIDCYCENFGIDTSLKGRNPKTAKIILFSITFTRVLWTVVINSDKECK